MRVTCILLPVLKYGSQILISLKIRLVCKKKIIVKNCVTLIMFAQAWKLCEHLYECFEMCSRCTNCTILDPNLSEHQYNTMLVKKKLGGDSYQSDFIYLYFSFPFLSFCLSVYFRVLRVIIY